MSGLLRQSNLVMWDRETESWWQQGTADAIVGEMAGRKLDVLPFQIVAYRDFKEAFPNGQVLLGPRGDFYYNPYENYDSASRPFLFGSDIDRRLPTMERVVGVQFGGETKAYPFTELAKERVVHDSVADREFVIFYEPSTVSSLDDVLVRNSRAVGSAAVFAPQSSDLQLEFEFRDGAYTDKQTGSKWDFLGNAIEGPLKGERLPAVFHMNSLWFYWAAAHQDTLVYESYP